MATFSCREYTIKAKYGTTECVCGIANDKEQIEIDNNRSKNNFARIQDLTGEKMILTGACGYGSEKTIVEGNELLSGEISACIVTLDGYEVRSAARVYTDNNPTHFSREGNSPGTKEQIEKWRKDNSITIRGLSWCGYRLVHEISARYIGDANYSRSFTPLAAAYQGFTWSERMDFIGTGRSQKGVHKNDTVLFAHKWWCGSSFGADTWYAMLPNGTIKEYYRHDLDNDKKRPKWFI